MVFGWGTSFRLSTLPHPMFQRLLRLTGRLSGESQDAHDQVYTQGGGYDNPNNQAHFSHELVAGGAAFEGFKLYEDHQRKEGKQPSATYSTRTKLSDEQENLWNTLSPRSCSWGSLVVKLTSSLRPRVCNVIDQICEIECSFGTRHERLGPRACSPPG